MGELVSIILPIYNNGKYLAECFDSLINQTYANIEIIAIDDGSSDDSLKILNEYAQKDSRIKPFKNDKNLGLIKNLNRAIGLCSGHYIARMDGDDICFLDRIEKQVKFLASDENKDVGIISSGHYIIDKDGNRTGKSRKVYHSREGIKYTAMLYSPTTHPAIFCRASLLKKYLYKDAKEITNVEDMTLWLQLIKDGYKIVNLPEPILLGRQHGENVSVLRREEQWNNGVRVCHSYAEDILDRQIDLKLFMVATARVYFNKITPTELKGGLELFGILLKPLFKSGVIPEESISEITDAVNRKRMRVIFEVLKAGPFRTKLLTILLGPIYVIKKGLRIL